jgi:Raf kinase inhibitor-like YbhB/YbcL family protein
MRRYGWLVAITVSACGGKTSVAVDAPLVVIDAPITIDALSTFSVTSTAFVEGAAIPVKHSCKGTNVSPALTWTPVNNAAGYAIVVTDTTLPLVHSVIWDIAAATTSVPEGVANIAEPTVPAGSKQTLAYDNRTRGYLGPCPTTKHTYEFAVVAVDVLPLPNVTLQSSRATVVAALKAQQRAIAKLTATFTP